MFFNVSEPKTKNQILMCDPLYFYKGSYSCECFDGYHVSSTSEKCIDTNECQLNTHDCHPVAICSNFQGSFDCLCPFGYEGDGHGAVIGCEDVDECYENTHSCQENQFCVKCHYKSEPEI